MQTTEWSDEHSQLINEAVPLVPPVSDEELDLGWAKIRLVVGHSEPTSRLRRKRIYLGAAVCAAVLGVGGVAAASVYSAHTGRYPTDAEDLRLGGPGERLDVTAPDYGTVLTHAIRDIPFPSEAARRSFVTAEVRLDQRGAARGDSVSTGALRFWSARSAVCAWADAWAEAAASSDAVAKARATRMLEQAPTWPAVTDLDPKQVITYKRIHVVDSRPVKGTTEVVKDNTEAGYFPLIRDAALADDAHEMGAVLAEWGACRAYGADMTHLPQAIPQK